MSKYTKREKYCNLCFSCKFGCKSVDIIEHCQNYSRGFSRFEYLDFIRENKVNLRKLCDKNNLSLNKMMDMLNGRLVMHYKYAYHIDSIIFEKTEYIKDIERFEHGEKQA